jgi:hypothetical protein
VTWPPVLGVLALAFVAWCAWQTSRHGLGVTRTRLVRLLLPGRARLAMEEAKRRLGWDDGLDDGQFATTGLADEAGPAASKRRARHSHAAPPSAFGWRRSAPRAGALNGQQAIRHQAQ